MERDYYPDKYLLRLIQFQSTRSAWSVTSLELVRLKEKRYFNPHAPHGA